jgi:hypothetical protein
MSSTVVGELLFQPNFAGGELALGVLDLPAGLVDLRRIRLPLGLRQQVDQRLLAIPPVGGEILVLAHERGQRVVAAGETRAQLLDGGRGRRLVCPLRGLERLARQRRRGLDALPRPRGQAGNVVYEKARPLLDQSVAVARLTRPRFAELGVRKHRRGRLARIGDGVGGLALGDAQLREVIERSRRVRMVGPAHLLVDGKRPLVGLLGVAVAALVLEHLSLVDEHGGDEAVLWPERFGGDVDRALELGVRIGVATLRIIGHAELADHLGGVGIGRAQRLRDDGKCPLGEGLQFL